MNAATQLEMFAPRPPRPPRGVAWERRPTGLYHFAHYAMQVDGEPNGAWIRHCGHQTALRPYYVVLPNGEILERKYRLLVEAKAAATEAIAELAP